MNIEANGNLYFKKNHQYSVLEESGTQLKIHNRREVEFSKKVKVTNIF